MSDDRPFLLDIYTICRTISEVQRYFEAPCTKGDQKYKTAETTTRYHVEKN